MPLGDGIRRNIAHVSQVERDRFIAAIRQLDAAKFFPDGVSYWDKQDEIHQVTHVHQGPAFLPWHRELCNRLEAMLRGIDPDLSLHYWDWTTDPRATSDGAGGTVNLFTNTFMGSASGRAGVPLDTFDNNGVFAGSRQDTGNPADPPQVITRGIAGGAPSNVDSDATLIAWGDSLSPVDQYPAFHLRLEGEFVRNHDAVHVYIGGTIGQPHSAFEDPFVFLLHSNVDRLWAMWQTQPGREWRLDPDQVYGTDGTDPSILENLEPWAGGTGTRPWAPPENEQVVKNSKHLSVVIPPCYDTLLTEPGAVEATNPGMLIDFNDVPEGETGARAAVFEVHACREITLEIQPGGGPNAPYSVLLPPGSVTVAHGTETPTFARIWFAFTGGAPNTTAPTGSVTIHCVETGQTFTFILQGNSIARPTVAVCMALDKSGSMDWLAGIDGSTKRIELLHEAGARFAELVPANSGVGVVRFDHDAYPGTAVARFGQGSFDPNRIATVQAVQNTMPGGATSVGDGVALARNTLNPVVGYDQKALLVFTDGLENTEQFIADVSTSINDRTFAVGLGTAQQVSMGALDDLTRNTGGYLLLTGHLSSSLDDYFRLSKYFMQVLAGVTNVAIVTDPVGILTPGMKVRIPFVLSETDIEVTVVLLTDLMPLPFAVETPAGDFLNPGTAGGVGATFGAGTNMSFFRFTLPLALGAGGREGTWHILLELPKAGQYAVTHLAVQPHLSLRSIKYCATVQARSNLRMIASVSQTHLEPGAIATVNARLTEYGIPVVGRASVRVEVERPDQSKATLKLAEVEPGAFEVDFVCKISGVYRLHVVASGVTLRNRPFTREQLLSAAVFRGGNLPPRTSTRGGDLGERLCELLRCLVGKGALQSSLAVRGVDQAAAEECIRRFCEKRTRPSERELQEREGTARG